MSPAATGAALRIRLNKAHRNIEEKITHCPGCKIALEANNTNAHLAGCTKISGANSSHAHTAFKEGTRRLIAAQGWSVDQHEPRNFTHAECPKCHELFLRDDADTAAHQQACKARVTMPELAKVTNKGPDLRITSLVANETIVIDVSLTSHVLGMTPDLEATFKKREKEKDKLYKKIAERDNLKLVTLCATNNGALSGTSKYLIDQIYEYGLKGPLTKLEMSQGISFLAHRSRALSLLHGEAETGIIHANKKRSPIHQEQQIESRTDETDSAPDLSTQVIFGGLQRMFINNFKPPPSPVHSLPMRIANMFVPQGRLYKRLPPSGTVAVLDTVAAVAQPFAPLVAPYMSPSTSANVLVLTTVVLPCIRALLSCAVFKPLFAQRSSPMPSSRPLYVISSTFTAMFFMYSSPTARCATTVSAVELFVSCIVTVIGTIYWFCLQLSNLYHYDWPMRAPSPLRGLTRLSILNYRMLICHLKGIVLESYPTVSPRTSPKAWGWYLAQLTRTVCLTFSSSRLIYSILDELAKIWIGIRSSITTGSKPAIEETPHVISSIIYWALQGGTTIASFAENSYRVGFACISIVPMPLWYLVSFFTSTSVVLVHLFKNNTTVRVCVRPFTRLLSRCLNIAAITFAIVTVGSCVFPSFYDPMTKLRDMVPDLQPVTEIVSNTTLTSGAEVFSRYFGNVTQDTIRLSLPSYEQVYGLLSSGYEQPLITLNLPAPDKNEHPQENSEKLNTSSPNAPTTATREMKSNKKSTAPYSFYSLCSETAGYIVAAAITTVPLLVMPLNLQARLGP